MTIELPCPSCNRRLRLEGDVIGRMVKCPSCATTFTAMALEPSPDLLDGQRQPKSPEVTNLDAPPRADERESISPELGPAGWRREYDDRDAEDWPRSARRDDLEDEDHPYRFGRAGASSAVAGPAIALMIYGGLHLLGGLVTTGFFLYLYLVESPGGSFPASLFLSIFAGLGVIIVIMGGLIAYGAIRMKRLKSYGLAMTACILALFSPVLWGIVGFIGVGLGVWALVVLSKPHVKAAFR